MGSILSSDAVVSAVIAAVLGALASHLVGAYFQRRKEKRLARENLVGELASLVNEYVAALMELHVARTLDTDRDWNTETRKRLSEVTRLDGQAMQFEIRLWQAFRDRKVRAGFFRLYSRFERTKELILQETCPPYKEVDMAFSWIAEKASETTEYAAKEAGFSLRDPARVVFVGFRKVTPEDKRKLSFEDEPPPWVFDIRFDFENKVDPSELKEATERMTRKVGSMRCPIHGRPAHIALKGRGIDSFSLNIEGCCREFIETVYTCLTPAGADRVIARPNRG